MRDGLFRVKYTEAFLQKWQKYDAVYFSKNHFLTYITISLFERRQAHFSTQHHYFYLYHHSHFAGKLRNMKEKNAIICASIFVSPIK